MISKIIFSLTLLFCIVLLFLDKKQSTNQQNPEIPPKKPQTPSNKKTIDKWTAYVPMNNQSTTQEPIVLYTGLNTIKYGNNNTYIPIGTYKTKIQIESNLVVENIGDGKVKFTTIEDKTKYYLTYSKNGDKDPEKDLDKGQLYWTTQQNKEIVLYKNDKNLLFLVENGKPTNKQVYFMWYGRDKQNRQNDSGYFLLKDKNKVGLTSNPNLVTYFFKQAI